jgi:hypothetical protein
VGSYPNPKIAAGAIRAAKLGSITTVTETSTPIATNSWGGISATCPVGSVLISGGGTASLLGAYLTQSRKEGNAWAAGVWNPVGVAATVTAYAYCLAS